MPESHVLEASIRQQIMRGYYAWPFIQQSTFLQQMNSACCAKSTCFCRLLSVSLSSGAAKAELLEFWSYSDLLDC